VDSITTGIDLVKTSAKPHAHIGTRDYLYYCMLKFGKKLFHLPPQTQDSAFSLDLMAIAMRKGFKYKKQFNKLYVNKKIFEETLKQFFSVSFIAFQISEKVVLSSIGDEQKSRKC